MTARLIFMLLLALAAAGCAAMRPARPPAWTNSLGMTFAEVPLERGTVLMACLETQERHLAPFRREKNLHAPAASLPAAQVSWLEAVEFCRWLTRREQQAGLIRPAQHYRLPTDHEWSCAAGLRGLEDARQSPESKYNRLAGIYPWGSAWPPPPGAGNLCGRESKKDFPENFIAAYRDAFSGGKLAPQASAANPLGLHDLSGNLWEWCQDLFRDGTDWRVLRGGSWKSARPQTLLSSHRTHDPESYRSDSVGFRCVLAGE